MQPVMFSDFVNALRAIADMPAAAFLPFLAFALVFWVLGKLFRALVLSGHTLILLLVALGVYAMAGQMVREGQYVLAIIAAVPLLFIGREGYRRLLTSSDGE